MKKMISQGLSLLAVTLCLLAPESADAGLQVTLNANGSTDTIFVDGGAGDMDPAGNSIVNFSTVVGGVTFNFTISVSNTPGVDNMATIRGDVSIVGTILDGSVASIYVSSDGFTAPLTDPPISARTTITATPLTSTVSGDYGSMSFLDASAGNGMTTSPAGTPLGEAMVTASTSVQAMDDFTLIPVQTVSPFTLGLLIKLENNTGSNQTYDVQVDGALFLSHVPEPTSMAIMGLGTLLAGFGVRRRKRKLAELAA